MNELYVLRTDYPNGGKGVVVTDKWDTLVEDLRKHLDGGAKCTVALEER